MKDLYQVLGLLHTAENEVIKAAYKALAQKYHPDRHPEKKFLYTEIMAELNHAHAMLGTARKRKDFDAAWKKFTDKHKRPEEPSPQSSPVHEAQPVKSSDKHETVLSHLSTEVNPNLCNNYC
jgi:curved DNA-binding protein CbpA